MPILVNKTYLVLTEDIDEAYDLTKIANDKVDIFAVGRIVNYDPSAQVQPTPPAAVHGQPAGQPVVPPHLQPKPPAPPSGTK